MANGWLSDDELEQEVERLRRRRRRPSAHLLWVVPLLFAAWVLLSRMGDGAPSLDRTALALADEYVRDVYVRHDCAATRQFVADPAATVEQWCGEQRNEWHRGVLLVRGSRRLVEPCGLRALIGPFPSTPAKACVRYELVRRRPTASGFQYAWGSVDLVLGRGGGSWQVFGWGGPPSIGTCTSGDAPCPGERLWQRRLPATDLT